MVLLLEVGKLQLNMLCTELPSSSDDQRQVKVEMPHFSLNSERTIHLLQNLLTKGHVKMLIFCSFLLFFYLFFHSFFCPSISLASNLDDKVQLKDKDGGISKSEKTASNVEEKGCQTLYSHYYSSGFLWSYFLLLFSVVALNKNSEKKLLVGKATTLHNDLGDKTGCSEKQRY